MKKLFAGNHYLQCHAIYLVYFVIYCIVLLLCLCALYLLLVFLSMFEYFGYFDSISLLGAKSLTSTPFVVFQTFIQFVLVSFLEYFLIKKMLRNKYKKFSMEPLDGNFKKTTMKLVAVRIVSEILFGMLCLIFAVYFQPTIALSMITVSTIAVLPMMLLLKQVLSYFVTKFSIKKYMKITEKKEKYTTAIVHD